MHAGFAQTQENRWNIVNGAVFAVLALAPVLLVWLGTCTAIDLALADAMFDRQLGAFPWRHAWLTEIFGHVILKRVFTGLAIAFIVLAAWDWARPTTWLRRFQLRVVALSAILVPAAVSLLKQASASHCPWDLERYGGIEPYVRLLQAMPAGVDAGNCMPAGHASSALWMVSFAVCFLPRRPRAAGIVAGVMLTAGFTVGWMQQLRGAHFLTHTLWSMWIACAVVFALITALDRRRYRSTSSSRRP
ncbi:phosphatase PAP2 family protein [Massilia cavernae]|uniref:Phosphatase PAP2 family protein n=2 Tax=Massilia cavernae TaxID=2320864 RepID=A0A418X7T7_9BURK|nr:phosphatase PAP2 family protein [Massilia cavernae]